MHASSSCNPMTKKCRSSTGFNGETKGLGTPLQVPMQAHSSKTKVARFPSAWHPWDEDAVEEKCFLHVSTLVATG